VDLTFQRLRRGDTLVLCSDGLSGQVTRDDIAQVVNEEKDLVQACRRLIEMANEAGGPDNITVIIARFDGEGLNEMGEGDDVGHRVFALADGGATPPVGMERMTEGPTQPLRMSGAAASRATSPVVATPPVIEPDSEITDAPTLETIDAVQMDELTTGRRSRGVASAIALLVLLLAAAGWYAVRIVTKAQPDPAPTTAPRP
jgi:hypothetical protein